MSSELELITYAQTNVAPVDDAVMWETAIGTSGIIYGGVVTMTSANVLHITGGHGVICGRKFTIYESNINVTLSSSGSLLGRVYVHLDLSNTELPLQLLVETGAALTPVVQEENVNITNGVYEFNVATFDVNEITVSNVQNVSPIVSSGKSNVIAAYETGSNASQAFAKGEYVIWRGVMYEVTAAIAQGDAFVIGTNLSANDTTVGEELTTLNSSLSEFAKIITVQIPSSITPKVWTPIVNLVDYGITSDYDKYFVLYAITRSNDYITFNNIITATRITYSGSLDFIFDATGLFESLTVRIILLKK